MAEARKLTAEQERQVRTIMESGSHADTACELVWAREACEAARAWICRVCNEYILPDAEPHDVLVQLRRALER